jgi:hypothetical protein
MALNARGKAAAKKAFMCLNALCSRFSPGSDFKGPFVSADYEAGARAVPEGAGAVELISLLVEAVAELEDGFSEDGAVGLSLDAGGNRPLSEERRRAAVAELSAAAGLASTANPPTDTALSLDAGEARRRAVVAEMLRDCGVRPDPFDGGAALAVTNAGAPKAKPGYGVRYAEPKAPPSPMSRAGGGPGIHDPSERRMPTPNGTVPGGNIISEGRRRELVSELSKAVGLTSMPTVVVGAEPGATIVAGGREIPANILVLEESGLRPPEPTPGEKPLAPRDGPVDVPDLMKPEGATGDRGGARGPELDRQLALVIVTARAQLYVHEVDEESRQAVQRLVDAALDARGGKDEEAKRYALSRLRKWLKDGTIDDGGGNRDGQSRSRIPGAVAPLKPPIWGGGQ